MWSTVTGRQEAKARLGHLVTSGPATCAGILPGSATATVLVTFAGLFAPESLTDTATLTEAQGPDREPRHSTDRELDRTLRTGRVDGHRYREFGGQYARTMRLAADSDPAQCVDVAAGCNAMATVDRAFDTVTEQLRTAPGDTGVFAPQVGDDVETTRSTRSTRSTVGRTSACRG
jgi:hypothetical protein